MSRDGTQHSLHHDLGGSLSAVRMNLQTLEALEAGESDVPPEKRLAIVRRAMAALAEVVEMVDRLKAERSSSTADRS